MRKIFGTDAVANVEEQVLDSQMLNFEEVHLEGGSTRNSTKCLARLVGGELVLELIADLFYGDERFYGRIIASNSADYSGVVRELSETEAREAFNRALAHKDKVPAVAA